MTEEQRAIHRIMLILEQVAAGDESVKMASPEIETAVNDLKSAEMRALAKEMFDYDPACQCNDPEDQAHKGKCWTCRYRQLLAEIGGPK